MAWSFRAALPSKRRRTLPRFQLKNSLTQAIVEVCDESAITCDLIWRSWPPQFSFMIASRRRKIHLSGPRRHDSPWGGDQKSADASIPAGELANLTHIEWRSASASDETPIFLTAAVHFTVLDVDTLAPNWGETIRGIRAGLSVDRTTFKTGERVPLHPQWENMNAEVPLTQLECRANALYRDSRLRASRFENDSVGRRLPRSRWGTLCNGEG